MGNPLLQLLSTLEQEWTFKIELFMKWEAWGLLHYGAPVGESHIWATVHPLVSPAVSPLLCVLGSFLCTSTNFWPCHCQTCSDQLAECTKPTEAAVNGYLVWWRCVWPILWHVSFRARIFPRTLHHNRAFLLDLCAAEMTRQTSSCFWYWWCTSWM